ncbi:hypothetical protein AVEN_151037-1 [Araneus ventricosus]|uniref:Mos1 transposase HTH domain-containing protein n=1 Tax=Araneus ventricosus TaxID=182803 RepID=A0A4Y2IC07_ARAVE|nr:hypothetical protein AVEN_151037-1 [Araneus ventricosus]
MSKLHSVVFIILRSINVSYCRSIRGSPEGGEHFGSGRETSPVNEGHKSMTRKKVVVLKFGTLDEGSVLNDVLKVPGRAGARGGPHFLNQVSLGSPTACTKLTTISSHQLQLAPDWLFRLSQFLHLYQPRPSSIHSRLCFQTSQS